MLSPLESLCSNSVRCDILAFRSLLLTPGVPLCSTAINNMQIHGANSNCYLFMHRAVSIPPIRMILLNCRTGFGA